MNDTLAGPRARAGKFLQVTEVDRELVVYDMTRFKAHRLNATAAAIWRACDGQRSIDEIHAVVNAGLDGAVSVDAVRYGLTELDAQHLLDGPVSRAGSLSRRELMAVAGATALVALPVVSSMVIPTPAEAQSSFEPPSSSNSSG